MENEIVPTILTREPTDLLAKIKNLEGLVSRVQIDIIDGLYLPEQTVSLESLKGLETTLKLDIHLMVKEPVSWIERCVEVLADRVIGQVEMMSDQQAFIEKAIDSNLGVGLGIDLGTDVHTIAESVPNLDLVLVMTRKAGFHDGEFERKALEKVKYLKDLNIPSLEIVVDGDLDEKRIQESLAAGANLFSVGGTIWKAVDVQSKIKELNSLVSSI